MHFHLPRPLHGWREFVGEVGIIVLGVLIALGAEQAIESLHNRGVAAQTRRDVRDEAAINLQFSRDRLQESRCIASRLSELATIVERGTVPADMVQWVGRPTADPMFTERWRAVTSSARTEMFPPREQERFDSLYGIFARLQEDELAEQAAWTDLRVLERLRGPIDAATRFALLRALEQARHEDSDIRITGDFALLHARQLSIAPNRDYGLQPGDVHSVCLPLSMPAQRAEELLHYPD